MKVIKIECCYVCPYYRPSSIGDDYCNYPANALGEFPFQHARKLRKTTDMKPPKWCKLEELN
jgi:hypothetical protein|nr:MAG TPA: hypothetical protein [Caudoviricetes sp.]